MTNTEKIKAGAGSAVFRFPETGYFPTGEFDGVHDDMHAKVLLLEQGESRGALVTLELPSIRPWELTDSLRAYAAELLSVSYENCWLIVTHDLSAPHVPKDPAKVPLHMDMLRTAVSEAAVQALNTLQPVTVSYREGSCSVNVNRDMQSRDGWWVGIHGNGPTDHTLSLLRFDGAEGIPVAALYTYPLKSSVMEAAAMSDGKHYASGDLTGLANVKSEKQLGYPVLFVMGAAGEQVPRCKASYLELDENRHFYQVDLKEAGWDALEELSDELSEAVCSAASENGEALEDQLAFDHFAFHADGQVSYPNTLPSPPVLHFDYVPTPGEDIPVWSLRIGNTVMLGLKPEVTIPVFDPIRRESPFPHTLMAVLVNGGQGYIAADSDYERFTYPGLKTPFRQGTDRVFRAEVLSLLKDAASCAEV